MKPKSIERDMIVALFGVAVGLILALGFWY